MREVIHAIADLHPDASGVSCEGGDYYLSFPGVGKRLATAAEVSAASREHLKAALYAECKRQCESLVPPYSTAERDAWTSKYSEAEQCAASGYTDVGRRLQRELNYTPGMSIQSLCATVLNSGDFYDDQLAIRIGSRTVVKQWLEGLTDAEIVALSDDDVITKYQQQVEGAA